MAGRLYFTYGVMGSAKTAELLIKAYNQKANGLKVMAIKPKTDRDPLYITSRIYGLKRKADFVITREDNIYDLIPEDIDSLFVDEVQFFTKEQIQQLSDLADDRDINIYTYGLKSDFRGQGFEGSNALFAKTDLIEEKLFDCRIKKCKNKATKNARFNDYEIQTEGEQVVIDDKTTVRYFALCKKCYTELVQGNIEKQNQLRELIDDEIKKEQEEKATEEAYLSLKEELEHRGILVEGRLAFELYEMAKHAAEDAICKSQQQGPVRIRKKDLQ